jgi:2-oxoglutarate dehydrogenase E2 component (dihydrolipoamide succinyltransferase)
LYQFQTKTRRDAETSIAYKPTHQTAKTGGIMPTKVIMPQLGESVVEGTVTKWLKSVGDRVEEFEPLLEVNTDKVDSEIPSPVSGTLLEILVDEGTTIDAGTVLAVVGEPDESLPDMNGASEKRETSTPAKEAEAPQEIKPSPTAAPAAGRDPQLGFISPVVSRIAQEHKVDLWKVTGTGQGGRITKKDILDFVQQRDQASQAAPVIETTGRAAAVPTQTPQPPTRPSALPGELLPLTPVRRAIAEHMVLSKHTSPHVTTVMEADLMRVVAHREANKAVFARDGANLTYTAYFVSAAVAGLKSYPMVNSSWSEEGIRLHHDVHIGVATALGDEGLIVPVIKNADRLSLLGLARTINDLASRARAKQLQPVEVKGGTFTITNHGTSGSLFATPIINQPQCSILGVGAIQKRVVVINDAIAIRPMVYISLTFDHRILDGATADYFLGRVVESLENWS